MHHSERVHVEEQSPKNDRFMKPAPRAAKGETIARGAPSASRALAQATRRGPAAAAVPRGTSPTGGAPPPTGLLSNSRSPLRWAHQGRMPGRLPRRALKNARRTGLITNDAAERIGAVVKSRPHRYRRAVDAHRRRAPPASGTNRRERLRRILYSPVFLSRRSDAGIVKTDLGLYSYCMTRPMRETRVLQTRRSRASPSSPPSQALEFDYFLHPAPCRARAPLKFYYFLHPAPRRALLAVSSADV